MSGLMACFAIASFRCETVERVKGATEQNKKANIGGLVVGASLSRWNCCEKEEGGGD